MSSYEATTMLPVVVGVVVISATTMCLMLYHLYHRIERRIAALHTVVTEATTAAATATTTTAAQDTDTDDVTRIVRELKRERDLYEQLYHQSLLTDATKCPTPVSRTPSPPTALATVCTSPMAVPNTTTTTTTCVGTNGGGSGNGRVSHTMKRYTRDAIVELRKFEKLGLSVPCPPDVDGVDGVGGGRRRPGRKVAVERVPFRILRANNEECTFEGVSDALTVKSQAENLVRLVWETTPRNVLLVKKPFDLPCMEALLEAAQYLHGEHGIRVCVEPQVMQELMDAATTSQYRTTPTSEEKASTMQEAVHRREKPIRTPNKAHLLGDELTNVARELVKHVCTWRPDDGSDDDVSDDDGGDGGDGSVVNSSRRSVLGSVDFIVCLGGDGCLLWVSRLFPEGVPPTVSFAMGSLGFLTPFPFNQANMRHTLTTVIKGGFQLSLRRRLRVLISRGGIRTWRTVLNEVIADRGSNKALTNLDCYCDDEFFTKVQADGVIVGTPTGSTAYSLSAGGSMVHPEVALVCFTPICPHSLAFRPLLFSDSCTLRLQVSDDARAGVSVSFDGHGGVALATGDWIECRMSLHPVPSICRSNETIDWFRAVKQVLQWNVRAKQKSTTYSQRARKDAAAVAAAASAAASAIVGQGQGKGDSGQGAKELKEA